MDRRKDILGVSGSLEPRAGLGYQRQLRGHLALSGVVMGRRALGVLSFQALLHSEKSFQFNKTGTMWLCNELGEGGGNGLEILIWMLSLLLLPLVDLFPLTMKLPCRAPGRKIGELGWFLFCKPSPACLELRVFRTWEEEEKVMRQKKKKKGAESGGGEELQRDVWK